MYAATDANYTLFVDYDPCAPNPRKYNENLGHMICWHRRCNLGDRHQYESTDEFYIDLYRQVTGKETDDWQEARDALKKTRGFIIKPLFLLDHSFLRVNTTGFYDPWDSGQVGYIYCTPEEVLREFRSLEDDAIEYASRCLEDEVNVYDHYLNNECWEWRLYKGINEYDSCGVFWGDFGKALLDDISSTMPNGTEYLVDLLDDIDEESEEEFLLGLVRKGVIKLE